jgi:uncharacterized protein (TIGR02145 family)
MKMITSGLVILITFNLKAQTGIFTDSRDGNIYQTITIGNKIWMREHLRLKTGLSYFPNKNKETTGLKYGNYYSNKELNSLCPKGWHLASVEEFKEYISILTLQNNIPDSSISVTTSKDIDSSQLIRLGNFNALHDTLLKLAPIGWVEGKKIKKDKSLTLWVKDLKNHDDKFHIHIGSLGYSIHTHFHNIVDKPKLIRMFTTRCVCDLNKSEY